MSNNSTRLFQKRIAKSLFTAASTAALLLGSSGALGAGARTVLAPAVFGTGDGLDGGNGNPFITGSTLQYTTDNADTVNANLAVNVQAIDTASHTLGIFTVNNNISLGAVGSTVAGGGGNKLPITINDGFTLTLTGTAGAGIVADDYTYLGTMTFPAAGGAANLTVQSNSTKAITLGILAPIVNGAQATLNAETAITFKSPTAPTIGIVNINGGANNYVEFNADEGDLTILPTAASRINFTDNASTLIFSTTEDNKGVTFANSLDGKLGGGGIVKFVGPNYDPDNYVPLAFGGTDNTKSLGSNANKFAVLGIQGAVFASGEPNSLNISNILKLDVYNEAYFVDGSGTSSTIATINIGADAGAGAGAAIYSIDAKDGDFGLMTGGQQINFLDDNSNLELRNTSNANDRTVTLNNDLIPGGDNTGIITLTSTAGKALNLTAAKGLKKLGDSNHIDPVGAPDPRNLKTININGTVNSIYDGANGVDISGVLKLNINADANFADQTATSTSIPAINIGDANGSAIYKIDVSQSGGRVDLIDNANSILFMDANSKFVIQNTVAAVDTTVTVKNSVIGGVFDKDDNAYNGNGGTINLVSTDANTLTVQSEDGTQTLGGDISKLNAIGVTGKVTASGVVGKILNMSNALALNVNKGAVFTDNGTTSAAIESINIGTDPAGKNATGAAQYNIDVSTIANNGNVNISTNTGAGVTFLNAGSLFQIENKNGTNVNIIFNNNINSAAAGGGGIVNLFANNDPNAALTLQSSNGIKTFGSNRTLSFLQIQGKVTVANDGTNTLDLSNMQSATLFKGTVFTDNSASSAGISIINIGAGAGKATYIVDVSKATADVNFLKAGAGNVLTFLSADSVLTIQNTTATSQTVIFNNNVVGFAGGGGIVNLTNTNAKGSLILGSSTGGQSLGTAPNNKIAQLNITGVVEFLGEANNAINFANTAVLNVYKNATFTDASTSSAAIPTINIGADAGAGAGTGYYIIDASYRDATILDGTAINFMHANAGLGFSNFVDRANATIKFADNLTTIVGGGGKLGFEGGATNALTITSNAPANIWNIGDAGGAKFTKLDIFNKVITTDRIDLSGIQELNIINEGNFVDQSGTSAAIATINIGAIDYLADNVADQIAGPATHTIDAQAGNLALAGGAQINFVDPGSKLVLQNSSNADNRKITLGATIDPGGNNIGILELNSIEAGKTLTLAAGVAGVTIGTANNKLQQLIYSGAGQFDTTTDLVTINAINVGVNTTTPLNVGPVAGNLTFGAIGQVTQTADIGGDVDFNGNDATLILNGGVNVVGAVKNSGAIGGTLTASGASNIGSVNNISMLKVGAGAVTVGAAVGDATTITEIQGNGTKTLTLPANFNLTGGFNITGGQALGLSFADGDIISGVVGTAANPVGDITTAGAVRFRSSVVAKGAANLNGFTNFSDTFTNTGVVTLGKGSNNVFYKDVTATSFVANGATMNFNNNLAFKSNITGSGTTINLDTSQVAYTGTGSFTDTLTLNTDFDVASNSGGNILIKSGSTLDLSQLSNLALNITLVNLNINNIENDEEDTYKPISAETAGGFKPPAAANVTLTIDGEQNRFIKIILDTTSLTLSAEDVAEEVVEEEFGPGGALENIPNAAKYKEGLLAMLAAPNGSDAREAANNWGSFLTAEQTVEAESHLYQNSAKPSETIAAINTAIVGNISSNLTTLNARTADNRAAVAAGDEDIKLGGWINPFIGNATQKKRGNISGYKSDTTGGTVGFDGIINEDAVLGLAYTRADTDIKLKNDKQGDKNRVRSNIFSLYGLYNLPYNNLFVEGIASYGDSRVRSKSQRNIGVAQNTVGYQTATGKYKSENYTGQIMVGYNYTLPETVSAMTPMPVILTPLAGLRYSDIKDKGYKETGTTYQNLIVKGKNYNTFDGMLGARLSSNFNTGEVVLTPELYAMVDYAFKNKAPAIDARLQGMTSPFPTDSFKPAKTSFDLGAGLTVKHKMMEYGINYNTNIASKYFAQQGSVKVRVNL